MRDIVEVSPRFLRSVLGTYGEQTREKTDAEYEFWPREMGCQAMSQTRARTTLRTGHGSRRRADGGLVTGHLLKITRERAGLTQSAFAEGLGLDVSTIGGWESGRRPLSASTSAQVRFALRFLLVSGADPALLVLFDMAMDADSVIAHALDDQDATDDYRTHPLAGWVLTRTSAHMLAWTLTGAAPAALPPAPANTPRRRGPTPDAPLLGSSERSALFDHLRRMAEIADRAGEDGALLRRQALYLCSYDRARDTRAWLADMRGRRSGDPTRAAWAWADARSLATSLARYGELDVLHDFITRGMGDDAGEVANLNYWAYWLGLDALPRANDSFMTDSLSRAWDAGPLLRSLVDRLRPELACVDLNVHSVWALLAARPGLLATDRLLATDLRERVSELLDSGEVSQQSRRELDAVHYGLKLTNP